MPGFQQGDLSRKNLAYFSVHTSKRHLSRKTCQGGNLLVRTTLIKRPRPFKFRFELAIQAGIILFHTLYIFCRHIEVFLFLLCLYLNANHDMAHSQHFPPNRGHFTSKEDVAFNLSLELPSKVHSEDCCVAVRMARNLEPREKKHA